MGNRLQNILDGMGMILSITPPDSDIEQISLPNRSDKEALESDWIKIGGDMRKVIDMEQDLNESK